MLTLRTISSRGRPSQFEWVKIVPSVKTMILIGDSLNDQLNEYLFLTVQRLEKRQQFLHRVDSDVQLVCTRLV